MTTLRKLRRRRRLHNGAAHSAWKPHALAVDVRARGPEQFQRLGKFPELDADLLQYGIRVVLDHLECSVIEQLVIGNFAIDVSDRGKLRMLPRSAFRAAAARLSSSRSVAHAHLGQYRQKRA